MIRQQLRQIIGPGHNLGAIGEAGELYLIESDAWLKAANADTWFPVTGLHAGARSGQVSLDASNGKLILAKSGLYEIQISVSHSFSNSDGTPELRGAVYQNGEVLPESIFINNSNRTIAFYNSSGNNFLLEVTDIPVELTAWFKYSATGNVSFKQLTFSAKGLYS
jgi:hypothetical protein